MAILFSNATVLPMTASGDEPRTFTGAVGIDGDRIALVTASETDAAAFRAAHPDSGRSTAGANSSCRGW
ncbi:MAG: hypothetical protein ACLSHL_09270 [Alistipes communis]